MGLGRLGRFRGAGSLLYHPSDALRSPRAKKATNLYYEVAVRIQWRDPMGEMIQFKRPDGKTCPSYLATPKAGSSAPGSGDFFRGGEKLQRSSLSDQARQALRSSPSGHEAKSGAAMSEDGVGSGDSSVTGEREIEASAHAVAFDGGDGGRGIAGDCVH